MKYLIILICSLFLTSCTPLKVEFIPVDDVVLRHQYTPEYGLVTGIKGYYFVYGKMKLKSVTITSGTFVSMTKVAQFRIKDLIYQHPELDNQRVEAAIIVQEKKYFKNMK